MKLFRELDLRKQADEPILKMLKLWHKLCEEKFNISIEVLIGDINDIKRSSTFSNIPGEINTADIDIINGKVAMILLLESLRNIDELIIAHEIGH